MVRIALWQRECEVANTRGTTVLLALKLAAGDPSATCVFIVMLSGIEPLPASISCLLCRAFPRNSRAVLRRLTRCLPP